MRDKEWKKTEYGDRKPDWLAHNMIAAALANLARYRRASEEEDYQGIDVWREVPFDIKVTNGIPKTYTDYDEEFALFKWFLEHQDLDRFHPTDRIIVVLHNIEKTQLTPEDADRIAIQIEGEFLRGKYYTDVTYTLLGPADGSQARHPRYGEKHRMKAGLLTHY